MLRRLVIIAALALVLGPLGDVAAIPATPSPTVASPLDGRLGGTIPSLIARFGDPSWEQAGLIGYNAVDLAGVTTILVAYYDDTDTVTRLALVSLTRPDLYTEDSAIAASVAVIAPVDADCKDTAHASAFGNLTYGCQSKALSSVATPERLTAEGVTGEAGSFSYAVDPINDDYFEIIVRLGADSRVATPTPIPAPTEAPQPPSDATLDQAYPTMDLQLVALQATSLIGAKMKVTGTLEVVKIAPAGNVWPLGDQRPFTATAYLQLSSGYIWLFIACDREAADNLQSGDLVTVYAVVRGTQSFTNSAGTRLTQPLLLAEHILTGD